MSVRFIVSGDDVKFDVGIERSTRADAVCLAHTKVTENFVDVGFLTDAADAIWMVLGCES